MPKVSIIIPTYNREKLLGEAIWSVLIQTYKDFEVIVVDDGSIDDTKKIVESLKDPRIKYIYQKNQGVCTARNNGFKDSVGDYIVFLDSDDVLLQKAIELEVQALEKNNDVGLIFGRHYVIDEKGKVISIRKIKYRQPGILTGREEILKLLIYGNYIIPSETMIRRKAIIDVGVFNPIYSHGSEDYELWLRVARKYAISHIAEPVVKYRTSTNSISSNRNLIEHLKAHENIFSSVFNDSNVSYYLLNKRNKIYFHLYLRFASFANSQGIKNISLKYLFSSIKLNPGIVKEPAFLSWLYLLVKICIPIQISKFVKQIKFLIDKVMRNKAF